MNQDVVRIDVLMVFPLNLQTLSIYLGNEEKCFAIHVEPLVGRAIELALRGDRSERPLTHELMGYIFTAFEIKVERVVINALRSNTYYARLILRAQNEVHSKVIEIDARPSDCIVLAIQAKAPIYVSQEVWEDTEDKSEELDRIRREIQSKKTQKPGPDFGEFA